MPAVQIAAPATRNVTGSSHTGDPLMTRPSDGGSKAIAYLAHRPTRRATRRHAPLIMDAAPMTLGFSCALVLTVSRRVWGFASDGGDGRRVVHDDLVSRPQHSAHVAGRNDRGAGGIGENVVAGTDRHPADYHRTVRLIGGDDVTAPPRCFATAVDGQVVLLKLAEVAQPPVGENAGEPLVLDTRQLRPATQ